MWWHAYLSTAWRRSQYCEFFPKFDGLKSTIDSRYHDVGRTEVRRFSWAVQYSKMEHAE